MYNSIKVILLLVILVIGAVITFEKRTQTFDIIKVEQKNMTHFEKRLKEYGTTF